MQLSCKWQKNNKTTQVKAQKKTLKHIKRKENKNIYTLEQTWFLSQENGFITLQFNYKSHPAQNTHTHNTYI